MNIKLAADLKAKMDAVDTVVDAIKVRTDAQPILTEYRYDANLAATTSFYPPAQTIIMVASILTSGQLMLLDKQSHAIRDQAEYGFFGAIYCDGTDGAHFYNESAGALRLTLEGVTMS